MNEFLETSLRRIRETSKGRPALMTHVVLGFPTLARSIELVEAMEQGGAKLIELQIPFSDPMADGPTIMHANEQALLQGATPPACLKIVEKLAVRVKVPLVVMTYYNIVFSYGVSANGSSGKHHNGLGAFCRDAGRSGVTALIVPDIPLEESADGYWTMPQRCKLTPIPLVSPVSTDSRLKMIAKHAESGFVYCVSTTGTTGARTALSSDLTVYLKRVRSHFNLPLAVGFGISEPSQVEALRGKAEIAIVGSAMIDLIRKTSVKSQPREVERFTARLAGR